jgi:phosphotransferase system enzyme I (PtsI)
MPELPDPTVPYVLLAAELSPADAALLDPARVLAVVTSAGSFLSHTAILARARGLPAVVACGGALDLPDGTLVTVDGTTGRVIIGGPRALSTAAGPVASAGAGLPGRTADGHPVALLANIGSAAELSGVDVEGVGLFRTELLFQHHVEPPTMTEQITAYAEVFAALPGRPVIVRTLDVGPDKPLPFLRDGFRGLRVVRGHDDILRTQLAAIAAAARGSTARVAVMAPMIATVTEATQFAARCREAGLATVGVMIEVPAAAVRAAEILRVVDFLSVGTNDLSQYAFAADRGRAELADLLDPWQPALLSLVAMTADAGTRAGRPVGVCGEAAADPALAVVLAGMGVNSLSMTPAAIPAVRAALAAHTLDECRAIARAALAADDPAGARSAHTGTPETQHL